MKPGRGPLRVVAFDLRAKRFGFVALERVESAARLLDWGIRGFRNLRASAVRPRIAQLLDMYQPSIVVLSGRSSHRTGGRTLRSGVEEECAKRRIHVRLVDHRVVKEHFGKDGCKNKHDIATAISRRFPDLAWKLPARRRLWQTEACQMTIFDAAALALAWHCARDHG